MSDFYDKNGKPLKLMQWAKLMENLEYRRVALDQFGVYEVSTVWLGLDHSFGLGRPAIFESAIINHGDRKYIELLKTTFSNCDVIERYSTIEEALEGHKLLCDRVRAAVSS